MIKIHSPRTSKLFCSRTPFLDQVKVLTSSRKWRWNPYFRSLKISHVGVCVCDWCIPEKGLMYPNIDDHDYFWNTIELCDYVYLSWMIDHNFTYQLNEYEYDIIWLNYDSLNFAHHCLFHSSQRSSWETSQERHAADWAASLEHFKGLEKRKAAEKRQREDQAVGSWGHLKWGQIGCWNDEVGTCGVVFFKTNSSCLNKIVCEDLLALFCTWLISGMIYHDLHICVL